MAQNSDLAAMDIVQMDYEPLFCQWPLHPAALDSMTAMEFPAKKHLIHNSISYRTARHMSQGALTWTKFHLRYLMLL